MAKNEKIIIVFDLKIKISLWNIIKLKMIKNILPDVHKTIKKLIKDFN